MSTCDVPASPVVTSTTGSDGSVSMVWNVPSGNGCVVTGYMVYLRHMNGSVSDRQWNHSVSASTTSYVWQGDDVISGQSYEVCVSANNSVGMGVPSNWSSPVSTCDVPASPTVSDVTTTLTSLTVSWTAPMVDVCAVFAFVVFVEHMDDGSVFNTSVPCNRTEYTWVDLPPGKQYCVSVAAVNAVGAGLPSVWSKLVSTNFEFLPVPRWAVYTLVGCLLSITVGLKSADYRCVRSRKDDGRCCCSISRRTRRSLPVSISLFDRSDSYVELASSRPVHGAAASIGTTTLPSQHSAFASVVLALSRLGLSWIITTCRYAKDHAMVPYLWQQLASIAVCAVIGGVTVGLFFVRARSYYAYGTSARTAATQWMLKGGLSHRVLMVLAIVKPGVLQVLLSGASDALDAPYPLSFSGWRYCRWNTDHRRVQVAEFAS